MKRIRLVILICLYTVFCSACAHKEMVAAKSAAGSSVVQNSAPEAQSDRMMIWNANLVIEGCDVNAAITKAIAIAEKNGGYLESKSENSEQSANARLRIPAAGFKGAVASFETLGKVKSRNVYGEDVTEKYIDVEARLKNKKALRDKLKQLLDKAVDVKDIISIENELNRLQSDIDSMEGVIKSLKAHVEFATVDLTFKREQVLGPLGYVFKGLWWGVKKMFVLRD